MSFHLAVYVRAIITLSHIQEVDVIETGRVQLCLGEVLSLIIGAATFICQQNHLINEISLALFELYHVVFVSLGRLFCLNAPELGVETFDYFMYEVVLLLNSDLIPETLCTLMGLPTIWKKQLLCLSLF